MIQFAPKSSKRKHSYNKLLINRTRKIKTHYNEYKNSFKITQRKSKRF